MGIPQYRLAKEIGVPAQRIGQIIAGKRSVTADNERVSVPIHDTFEANARVNTDVPIQMTVSVDQTIPVKADIPIDQRIPLKLETPVSVDLDETLDMPMQTTFTSQARLLSPLAIQPEPLVLGIEDRQLAVPLPGWWPFVDSSETAQ